MEGVLELGKLCGQIDRGSGRGIWQPQVRLVVTLEMLKNRRPHPRVSELPLSAMPIYDRQPGAAGVTTVLDRESLTLVFHQRDRSA